MELEADYKRERSNGSGSEIAYTVEARYNYPEPVQIGTQIFDNRWREVVFLETAVGVPRCAPYQNTLKHQMLGYAAAQALRWWLHAAAEAEKYSLFCLETQIVSHKITHSHKIESVAAHEHIKGRDTLSPKEEAKA